MLEVEDYDLATHLDRLTLPIPAGLALLPPNVESAGASEDLLDESTAATIRSLWRDEGIQDDLVSESRRSVVKKDATLFLPTVVIGAAVMAQDPAAVTLALNIVGNYISEFFYGTFGKRRVKLEVVAVRKGRTTAKRVRYDGDPTGLPSVAEIVKALTDDE